MKRILNKITPPFIHGINNNLLKNDVLGWQLQLPLIIWLWFIINLVTTSVPLLYPLKVWGRSDIDGTIMIGIVIAVLQFFLFGYILIQFNATKIFAKKTFAHGLKEQFGYLIVMMLCLTYVVFMPLIIDYRKSAYMTEEQIKKEAVTYNKARHYFMDSYDEFTYFPNRSALNAYRNYPYSDTSRYSNQYEYYSEVIKPMLAPYFLGDTSLNKIDKQYTRSAKGPKLYYMASGYLEEDYNYFKDKVNGNYFDRENQEYQFIEKSDEKRLEEIKEFIALYKKYEALRGYYTPVKFKSPEFILEGYKSNRLVFSIDTIGNNTYYQDNEYDYYSNYTKIDNDIIEGIHRTVLFSKYKKWDEAGTRAMICFFVAFGFALLIFIFKNVRLKEFILTFVYSGILILLVSITVIISNAEFIPIHLPIAIFLIGLFFALTAGRWEYFSHKKQIFIIVSNIFFAFVPIFFFAYFYEYLYWWRFDNVSCENFPMECQEYREMIEKVRWLCIWGGIALYLLFGSLFYKKVYENTLTLPLSK